MILLIYYINCIGNSVYLFAPSFLYMDGIPKELKTHVMSGLTKATERANKPFPGGEFSSLTDYSESFAHLTEGKSLKELVEEKTAVLKRRPFVFNVMGHTEIHQELDCPGVSVTLIPYTVRGSRPVAEVQGNVLIPDTWEKIGSAMKALGIDEGFDLIVCRPRGGMDYITENSKVHLWLLNNMYNVLSSHDGLLLTQIHNKSAISLARYLRFLKDNLNPQSQLEFDMSVFGPDTYVAPGPGISTHNMVLKIVKHPEAPKHLLRGPKFKDLSYKELYHTYQATPETNQEIWQTLRDFSYMQGLHRDTHISDRDLLCMVLTILYSEQVSP